MGPPARWQLLPPIPSIDNKDCNKDRDAIPFALSVLAWPFPSGINLICIQVLVWGDKQVNPFHNIPDLLLEDEGCNWVPSTFTGP